MPLLSKYTVAKATGIPAVIDYANRHRLLVLAYHGIYDDSSSLKDLPETFVHVKNLKNQLTEIKKKYSIIQPDELRSALENHDALPPRSALITFDDGYESFYRLAFPVLESLGIKAIVFVNTKNVVENMPFWFDIAWKYGKSGIGKERKWVIEKLQINDHNSSLQDLTRSIMAAMKRMLPEVRDPIVTEMEDRLSALLPGFYERKRLFYPMNPGKIHSLSKKGIIFGGHTHNHTILTLLNLTQAEENIKKNKIVLESIVDSPCDYFAYPNGGKRDFSVDHKKILKKIGYIAAFSLTQGRTRPETDPMEISRINVAPEDTVSSLVFRCTGYVALKYKLKEKAVSIINFIK